MQDFFSQYKHIYLVGIKGAGMTALAELLTEKGIQVTGSDTSEQFYTDDILKRLQIFYTEGFQEENISTDIDLVIYSTAYKPENHPELIFAKKQGMAILSYPEAIGKLTTEKMTLAVCGTHGKTTTSSLLAETLRAIGEDPSAVVGSQIRQWGGSALAGKGRFFVLEADEYQNKLAFYEPFGVILTSVDYDHPDFFPTEESYKQVFQDFLRRIPAIGVLVYNGDDAVVSAVAESSRAKKISYGFLGHNDIQIVRLARETEGSVNPEGVLQSFELKFEGRSLGVFQVKLAGKHNAMNTAAVAALLQHFGILTKDTREAMAGFSGTARRFEFLGERFGALLYDDYAHHPEEIKTTLRAFKELYPTKNLSVVFHPHTYTRTKALLQEFAQSFDDADSVVVLPIYGSAREEHGGVSSLELVNLINQYSSDKKKAREESNYEAVVLALEKSMGKNDIIVSVGAGDVWQITHRLAKKKI